MKAIILAAGVGSRLRPLTADRPKCLVTVGGRSILARLLEQLATLTLNGVVIVTGYRSAMVEAAVAAQAAALPWPVRCVANPRYADTNNAYSLWLAREYLAAGVLLLDADLVLAPGILPTLAALPETASWLAVDSSRPVDDEAMKYRLNGDGRIAELSKQVPLPQAGGETLGLNRIAAPEALALGAVLDSFVRRGLVNEYYERAFQERIDAGAVYRVHDVAGQPWVEVDDLTDLARAQALAREDG